MRRSMGGAALLALVACAARSNTASSGAFTPEQRAQIVQIMRDAMNKDPSILRDAIVVVQADNERLEAQARRDALANRQGALYDAADPATGNPHAATTIVEFFDPRCPYCKALAPELTRFVAQDRNVRLVYKAFPILGPSSELSARALLAAQRQGKFEALRGRLMADTSEDELTESNIRAAARAVGLNWPQIRRAMDSPAVAKRLNDNEKLASDLGITGTPTLVIGQKIVEGADMPTIEAAVANARHDRSQDQSKPVVSLGRSSP